MVYGLVAIPGAHAVILIQFSDLLNVPTPPRVGLKLLLVRLSLIKFNIIYNTL